MPWFLHALQREFIYKLYSCACGIVNAGVFGFFHFLLFCSRTAMGRICWWRTVQTHLQSSLTPWISRNWVYYIINNVPMCTKVDIECGSCTAVCDPIRCCAEFSNWRSIASPTTNNGCQRYSISISNGVIILCCHACSTINQKNYYEYYEWTIQKERKRNKEDSI